LSLCWLYCYNLHCFSLYDPPVFELPGVGGVNPQVFFDPPNTLSNYVLGVSCILHTYNLHHNFDQSPTFKKFNPPANFSQCKHCELQPISERMIRLLFVVEYHSAGAGAPVYWVRAVQYCSFFVNFMVMVNKVPMLVKLCPSPLFLFLLQCSTRSPIWLESWCLYLFFLDACSISIVPTR